MVEDVGDQADGEVVFGDFGVEGLLVTDVERDGRGELDAGGKLLGGLEGTAGCDTRG